MATRNAAFTLRMVTAESVGDRLVKFTASTRNVDRHGTRLLPRGCRLVGCELVEDAVDLPSFCHPLNAAYVFGPERSSLSPAMLARCDHVVRIPTRFCINLAVAGAVVMYDRLVSLGRFAPRPLHAGGPSEAMPPHVHGPIQRFGRRLPADLEQP